MQKLSNLPKVTENTSSLYVTVPEMKLLIYTGDSSAPSSLPSLCQWDHQFFGGFGAWLKFWLSTRARGCYLAVS